MTPPPDRAVILGSGLVARSFAPLERAPGLRSALVMAAGVADSSTVDGAGFEREASALRDAIGDARRDGRRLVYFSGGGSIHGPTSEVRREDGPVRPTTAYGRHQLACEEIIGAADVPHLIVRLPNLVGARQNRAQLIPALVDQVLAGRVTVLGDAGRDLVDAGEMAAVVADLLDRAPDRLTVNVATGTCTPVLAIVVEIQSILGTSAVVDLRPGGDRQRFSIERMCSLLEGGADRLSDPVTVLRRHVPSLARSRPDGGR